MWLHVRPHDPAPLWFGHAVAVCTGGLHAGGAPGGNLGWFRSDLRPGQGGCTEGPGYLITLGMHLQQARPGQGWGGRVRGFRGVGHRQGQGHLGLGGSGVWGTGRGKGRSRGTHAGVAARTCFICRSLCLAILLSSLLLCGSRSRDACWLMARTCRGQAGRQRGGQGPQLKGGGRQAGRQAGR